MVLKIAGSTFSFQQDFDIEMTIFREVAYLLGIGRIARGSNITGALPLMVWKQDIQDHMVQNKLLYNKMS